MIDTYTSSKGEKILIKDMANPHLIHSIAKLGATIGVLENEASIDWLVEKRDLLKALKDEAIARLSPKE